MNNTLVVICVHHRIKVSEFTEALESIFLQTYKDFDTLIIQDGPILSELSNIISHYVVDSDHKIQCLNHPKNMGLAYSLNQAIFYAIKYGYDYIARMDADDISLPTRLSKQLQFLDANADIDACGTAIRYFGSLQKVYTPPKDCKSVEERFAYSTTVAHATVLFRSSFFYKSGLYSPCASTTIEDQRLWLSAFSAGCRIANISEPLYLVRTDSRFILSRFNFILSVNLSLIRLAYLIRKKSSLLCYAYWFASNLPRVVISLLIVPLKFTLDGFGSLYLLLKQKKSKNRVYF